MVRPVVVCHQLRSPDNLGAVARVMANFGLTELILSDPQTHDFRTAGRLAVKSDGVLANVAVAPSLNEALEGVVYAVGSTSREAVKRQTPLTPEEAVGRLAAHAARGNVALVLGGEKRGLSDDDLSHCHDVLVIPTDDAQPSMNLSHAAAVLLYLCARHDVPAPVRDGGASGKLLQLLEERLREVLHTAEFFNQQTEEATQHALKELSRALVRGGISEREAQVWLSALKHLGRHLR